MFPACEVAVAERLSPLELPPLNPIEPDGVTMLILPPVTPPLAARKPKLPVQQTPTFTEPVSEVRLIVPPEVVPDAVMFWRTVILPEAAMEKASAVTPLVTVPLVMSIVDLDNSGATRNESPPVSKLSTAVPVTLTEPKPFGL